MIREFFKLAVPTTLQYLMLALVGASDAFMLGRVGQDEMASVALATQFQFLQNMIIAAIAAGISILGAQYRGKRDNATVSKVFLIGLRAALVLSATFALGCILMPRVLMRIFTDQEGLVRFGVDYLHIAGFSYLLVGISQCCHSVFKVADNAHSSAIVSCGTVLLNVLLNVLLIFGFGPIAPMGVKGAALATLIARVVELIWLLVIAPSVCDVKLEFCKIRILHPRLSKDFWRCCLPVMGAYLVWSVGFSSYTGIFGHLGRDAAAANAIAAVVRDILSCLADGGAVAAGIIVGKELGAGNLVCARRYGARIVRLSVALALGSSALVLVATPVILNSVVLSDVARNYLIGMMVVLALYQVGRYVNTIVITGIFTSGGDTMFDFYSLVATMWGLAVPFAMLGAFVLHWPVAIVFACTCVDEVGKIPWTWAHYRKYLWVKDLTRSGV